MITRLIGITWISMSDVRERSVSLIAHSLTHCKCHDPNYVLNKHKDLCKYGPYGIPSHKFEKLIHQEHYHYRCVCLLSEQSTEDFLIRRADNTTYGGRLAVYGFDMKLWYPPTLQIRINDNKTCFQRNSTSPVSTSRMVIYHIWQNWVWNHEYKSTVKLLGASITGCNCVVIHFIAFFHDLATLHRQNKFPPTIILKWVWFKCYEFCFICSTTCSTR